MDKSKDKFLSHVPQWNTCQESLREPVEMSSNIKLPVLVGKGNRGFVQDFPFLKDDIALIKLWSLNVFVPEIFIR